MSPRLPTIQTRISIGEDALPLPVSFQFVSCCDVLIRRIDTSAFPSLPNEFWSILTAIGFAPEEDRVHWSLPAGEPWSSYLKATITELEKRAKELHGREDEIRKRQNEYAMLVAFAFNMHSVDLLSFQLRCFCVDQI